MDPLPTLNIPEPKYLNVDYIFYQIYLFLRRISGGGSGPTETEIYDYGDQAVKSSSSVNGVDFGFFASLFENLFYFLILLFLTVIAYCAVRMLEIRKKEHEHLAHEIAEYAHHQKEKERKAKEKERSNSRNPRWVRVLENVTSENEAQWKVAIIDADEMLDSMMEQMGYEGENLGERLKNVDRENFRSRGIAWEAHLVRNKIAHEGSEYVLTAREAKRVIALYEQIFREFGYI